MLEELSPNNYSCHELHLRCILEMLIRKTNAIALADAIAIAFAIAIARRSYICAATIDIAIALAVLFAELFALRTYICAYTYCSLTTSAILTCLRKKQAQS